MFVNALPALDAQAVEVCLPWPTKIKKIEPRTRGPPQCRSSQGPVRVEVHGGYKLPAMLHERLWKSLSPPGQEVLAAQSLESKDTHICIYIYIYTI